MSVINAATATERIEKARLSNITAKNTMIAII